VRRFGIRPRAFINRAEFAVLIVTEAGARRRKMLECFFSEIGEAAHRLDAVYALVVPLLRLTLARKRLAEARVFERDFILDVAEVVANRAIPRGAGLGFRRGIDAISRRPRVCRMAPALPIRFQFAEEAQIAYFQLVRHCQTSLPLPNA
jgi:hypothetical protein